MLPGTGSFNILASSLSKLCSQIVMLSERISGSCGQVSRNSRTTRGRTNTRVSENKSSVDSSGRHRAIVSKSLSAFSIGEGRVLRRSVRKRGLDSRIKKSGLTSPMGPYSPGLQDKMARSRSGRMPESKERSREVPQTHQTFRI